MKRREFIKLGGGAALLSVCPGVLAYHDQTVVWRGFRFTYHVELPDDPAPARLWLPMPDTDDSNYQRSMGSIWNGKADNAGFQNRPGGISLFYAEWLGKGPRAVTVSTIVKTADRHVHLERARGSGALPAEVRRYLKPSRHIATDGVVRTTAQKIAKGSSDPMEKARAIYDWVIENARYDEAARGLGRGDAKALFASGNLAGKSADISTLFVALCRAAGVPAREAFGIRMDDSELFKSLGAYGDVTREQHCRAEFFAPGTGWVPVDPANVCEAVAEEQLPLSDPKLTALKDRLFGAWEMNWCGFNTAEDVALARDSAAGALPFFAFPHAELGRQPRDSLEPATFAYRIESRELVGTGVKF